MVDRCVLTAGERAEVAELVNGVLGRCDSWDPLAFVDDSVPLAQELPARLRRFLVEARVNEVDVTVVSNLPVDEDLAPTPIGWDAAAKTGAGSREELVLLLCGSILGEPFGWCNQQDGRLVHDVVPVPGMEQSLTSASSSAGLSLHTEDVFHACRGDYVSLYCLRNPDAIGTTFVRGASLPFSPDMRELLSKEVFTFYPDDSHVGMTLNALDGDNSATPVRPSTTGTVLFGPKERPYFRFDIDFMEAEGDAAEAMREVQRQMASRVERVVLSPGDAVFIDNYRVVHGREPFTARFDGTDRWLKRVNLIRDVRRIYTMSASRSRIILG
ncbi:arginine beta-hydroxylase, Fe(II)/alpha-ketoglutarate-dependent [Amycolatopsis marina]|uniref:Arginine beta-hydroxylase, Fe(II)/alpha-ketoglutarate-dependent n=2 Tax=Amycolatopsis marina TaxID=490629 RepID=A0A1I0XWG4_9PSEU|nr:arginine beta-hydroxylase, Fe(II)/alpha-ketoglutarate-dependent [Amycolatopsis marina]